MFTPLRVTVKIAWDNTYKKYLAGSGYTIKGPYYYFSLPQGTASPKEFYAKNSRWTEGLISAAKAVGWGATVLV